MRSMLRWVGLMVVGFVLVSPVSGLAQAVTPDKLVGTWVAVSVQPPRYDTSQTIVREAILTVKADSTWTMQVRDNGKDVKPSPQEWPWPWSNTPGQGAWSLSQDTLTAAAVPLKVALRDQQLLVGPFPPKLPNPDPGFECNAKAFNRVDPSKPVPAATVPTPTVKPADVVGTWVRTRQGPVVFKKKGKGQQERVDTGQQERVDTTIIRPDGTSKQVSTITNDVGGSKTTRREELDGKWSLLAGDWFLVLTKESSLKAQVTLHDNQVVHREGLVCNGDSYSWAKEPILGKRIAP